MKNIEKEVNSVPTRESGAQECEDENIEVDMHMEMLNQNSDDENTRNMDVESAKKRKRRSVVWDHFEGKSIGGKWKAICNYCKKHLGGESKNGTKHLHDHLKTCVHKKQATITQCILTPTKSIDGSSKLGTYQFNQDHAREELGKMIVLHEYPLSMVEHVGFRRFLNVLQPLFKVVSRNTIKSDILKMFDVEKEKTLKLLETNASRIALTSDMWTSSNQKRGFMAITAHFIDDSWKLQSRLVRFVYVPCLHTAEVLANCLVGCLFDWNLDSKCSTLTIDNCTSNDAMVDIILEKLPPSSLILEGRLFHMRCSAHILNLVVKDGLELITETIENVRYSVAFWTATPKRDEKFVEIAKHMKIQCTKKLELDCKTRWNSTYLMLNTAIHYKDVFYRLKQREPLYKTVPTEEDWENVRVIASKLEIFYDATELFSGTKYVTMNFFFPTMCEIKLTIDEWINSNEIRVRNMASSMKEKFDKYWHKINCLFAIGSILDPRYKLKTIQLYYPLVYGDLSLEKIDDVKKVVSDMIEEYKKSQQYHVVYQRSQQSCFSSNPPIPKGGRLERFMESNSSIEIIKSELDRYLEDPLAPRAVPNFDILYWWKMDGYKYPNLQKIAKDVLAIPVTTVASESTFSTSGRVISAHRSRLHPNTIEALMCTRDWLWREIEAALECQNFDDDADVQVTEVCTDKSNTAGSDLM